MYLFQYLFPHNGFNKYSDFYILDQGCLELRGDFVWSGLGAKTGQNSWARKRRQGEFARRESTRWWSRVHLSVSACTGVMFVYPRVSVYPQRDFKRVHCPELMEARHLHNELILNSSISAECLNVQGVIFAAQNQCLWGGAVVDYQKGILKHKIFGIVSVWQ